MSARVIVGTLMLGLWGCGGSPTITGANPTADAQAAIAAGRARWAARKPTCEAYHYDRDVSPSPKETVSAVSVMTVQVVDDQPTLRWYVGDPSLNPMTPVEWIEEGASIGSHPGYVPAATVEQLWDTCEAALAAAPAALINPLTSSEEGAPISCVVFPGMCADAGATDVVPCFGGVQLEGFSCGTLVPPQLPDASVDGSADLVLPARADASGEGGVD